MFDEVPELLAKMSDCLWRAITCAVFQVAEHWHRRLDECKRKAGITEHQRRNHIIIVSALMHVFKAEMEGLGGGGVIATLILTSGPPARSGNQSAS